MGPHSVGKHLFFEPNCHEKHHKRWDPCARVLLTRCKPVGRLTGCLVTEPTGRRSHRHTYGFTLVPSHLYTAAAAPDRRSWIYLDRFIYIRAVVDPSFLLSFPSPLYHVRLHTHTHALAAPNTPRSCSRA